MTIIYNNLTIFSPSSLTTVFPFLTVYASVLKIGLFNSPSVFSNINDSFSLLSVVIVHLNLRGNILSFDGSKISIIAVFFDKLALFVVS